MEDALAHIETLAADAARMIGWPCSRVRSL